MSSFNDTVVLDDTMEEGTEDILALYGDEFEEVFSPGAADSTDILELLTPGKLLTAMQAVDFMEQQPSQGSARASSPARSWAQEMEEEEAASQGGVHVGPESQGLHHPSGVSFDNPMDGVELGLNQPELLEEELAREARRKAC